MVKTLREADRAPAAETIKKYGVSEQTVYAWRKKRGALEVAGVMQLRSLRRENERLKQILAELNLTMEEMKETNARKC
jgi:putative transposase